MNSPKALSLKQAVDLLRNKQLHPRELIEYYCCQIEKDAEHPTPLNAVIEVWKETALKTTEIIKKDSLLCGAPIFIKDNMHVKGKKVECCSRLLEGYISPYTGGACEKLIQHGGILLGRTNMDEFAMGSSNETSAKGIVRNPINRSYTLVDLLAVQLHA